MEIGEILFVLSIEFDQILEMYGVRVLEQVSRELASNSTTFFSIHLFNYNKIILWQLMSKYSKKKCISSIWSNATETVQTTSEPLDQCWWRLYFQFVNEGDEMSQVVNDKQREESWSVIYTLITLCMKIYLINIRRLKLNPINWSWCYKSRVVLRYYYKELEEAS